MVTRPVDWQDTQVSEAVVSGAQGSIRVDGSVTDVVARRMTAIRTIISLDVFSTTVAGAWGVQECAIGIGVISREAFAAGVFPDPVEATDKPARGWLWRTHRALAQNGTGTQVVTHIEGDFRGARKLDAGLLLLIVNNTPLSGTAFPILLRGLVRVLFKV